MRLLTSSGDEFTTEITPSIADSTVVCGAAFDSLGRRFLPAALDEAWLQLEVRSYERVNPLEASLAPEVSTVFQLPLASAHSPPG